MPGSVLRVHKDHPESFYLHIVGADHLYSSNVLFQGSFDILRTGGNLSHHQERERKKLLASFEGHCCCLKKR